MSQNQDEEKWGGLCAEIDLWNKFEWRVCKK